MNYVFNYTSSMCQFQGLLLRSGRFLREWIGSYRGRQLSWWVGQERDSDPAANHHDKIAASAAISEARRDAEALARIAGQFQLGTSDRHRIRQVSLGLGVRAFAPLSSSSDWSLAVVPSLSLLHAANDRSRSSLLLFARSSCWCPLGSVPYVLLIQPDCTKRGSLIAFQHQYPIRA